MSIIKEDDLILEEYKKAVLRDPVLKPYRLTPFIVTFCEGNLTSIDIQSFIEMGLRLVRFKMTHITKRDKIAMIEMINDAVKLNCEKYRVSSWPIALSIDIPSACIKTGYLRDEIEEEKILIKEGWIMKITCDIKLWNKCDNKKIFIDDPYTFKNIKPGTEITIAFGKIVLECIEVLDAKTVKCKVIRGDFLASLEFVCIRGVKHTKPSLSKIDMDLIAFAKDFGLDIITINSIRKPNILKKIRKMFPNTEMPLIMSTICEQEGLDNIDEIIENSDGIILAREFLAHEIIDKHKMLSIQLQVSGKCRKVGKPFYISGNILERTLLKGTVSACDLTDITNAVLQGSGFVLRSYKDTTHLLKAMRYLDDICKNVEALILRNDIWRMIEEYKMPVNAAEACILACALQAKQTNAVACIVPTVTGSTAIQLSHIAPGSIILTVSANPSVAKKLQAYRGIIPIIYEFPPMRNWYSEMYARINFAVTYGIRYDILKFGQTYITLRKCCPTSSFSDHIASWKVTALDNLEE